MPSNLDTIHAIYAAFGRGDVPAILEHLADDIEWDYSHDADTGVPYLIPGRGRAHVLAFFAAVAANLETRRFQVDAIVGDGPLVVAVCTVEWLVKPTGKTIAEEHESHVGTFDARGKVTRVRHAADTARHRRAFAR